MTIPYSVAIIGTGNIAWHLGNAFVSSGVRISEVLGRNKEKTIELSTILQASVVENYSELSADFIFVCVSDDNISSVIEQIPKHMRVVYTSGAVGILSVTKHDNLGVFYPLQTFGERVKSDFQNIPILIESLNLNLQNELKKLASAISSNVHIVNSEERLIYHLSAVWVNNFVNHLGSLAYDIMNTNKLNWELLKPLMEKTVKNLIDKNPSSIQTGPAKRNDAKTISMHLEKMNNEQKEVYKVLSESITKKYNPNG